MANLSRFSKVLMRQLEKKKIDQEMLRRAFPVMKFHLAAGRENPLSRFLFFKGIDYQEARLELSSDPLNGMGGRFDVSRFQQGNLQLDTIHFALISTAPFATICAKTPISSRHVSVPMSIIRVSGRTSTSPTARAARVLTWGCGLTSSTMVSTSPSRPTIRLLPTGALTSTTRISSSSARTKTSRPT